MKCINCGAEIKSEFKNCPYCGTASQIVPDYSVYDESDINIILESTKETPNKEVAKKPELTKDQRLERARAKKKAAEEAKHKRTRLTIGIVVAACVVIIFGGIILKITIDNNNANSFEYQIKKADAAMFKGDIETAEKYYLKALALSQDNVNVRLELADLYVEKKEFEESEKYLKEVIELDADNYDAYRMLYHIYKDAGDVDAILELKEGVTNNKILSIFSDYSVDSAMLSVKGGTYTEAIKIYITSKKNLDVFYTIDGSDPRKNGIEYKNAFELTEEGMHTVKVVTRNELGVYSEIITETYLIEYPVPVDPVFTPTGGIFTEPTYVVIEVPRGCSVYYTWDNTDPTAESTKYVGQFLVPEGENILSVIVINDETGITSGIVREKFIYTPEVASDVEEQ